MRRREVGFVFQDFHLLNELTAQENVELPALMAGQSPMAARRPPPPARAGRAGRPDGPSALRAVRRPAPTGGHRPGAGQPAAVWSWLTNRPATSTVPPRVDILAYSEELRAAGQTLVIVTHDERVAATADRVICMQDGVFVGETMLAGRTDGRLSALIGLGGQDT